MITQEQKHSALHLAIEITKEYARGADHHPQSRRHPSIELKSTYQAIIDIIEEIETTNAENSE